MLKTDYKNYIPPESGIEYQLETTPDGKTIITDVTEYLQEGDQWTAGIINETNRAVNESIPRNGADDITGPLVPADDNTVDIGSEGKRFRNIYGSLKGNADTATNANYATRAGNADTATRATSANVAEGRLTAATGYTVSNVRLFRDLSGTITLSFMAQKSSGNITTGEVVANLPVGFRPPGTTILGAGAQMDGSILRMEAYYDGRIVAITGKAASDPLVAVNASFSTVLP